MADLEEAGYLTHPHTSAGRVPSEKGYRFYVDCLGSQARPTRSAEAAINKALDEATSPEEMMSRACHLLSDICQNVGIVISPPIELSVFQHIEFVRIDDTKVLLILVSQAGLLQQRLIHLSEPYTQEELTRAGNYLVEKFSGSTLPQIRRELIRMMRQERLLYDRLLANLVRSWSCTLDESEPASESVYVQGTGNILSKLDLSDVGPIEELFQLFEEKGRLVKILNACLPPEPEEGVQIMIGSELGPSCMKDFTLITSPYLQGAGAAGFVGVIGPTRMEYRTGISVVGYLAEVFSRRIGV